MKHVWILLILLSQSVQAAEVFPIKAGDGSEIRSPIDTKTVLVVVGKKKVQIPASMVYVPAGRFTFGKSEQRELPAFCIGRFEVTNAEFKAFLDDSGYRGTPRYWKAGTYPTGKANHPVLFVSLDDTDAYCQWISKETGWNVVVPTNPVREDLN